MAKQAISEILSTDYGDEVEYTQDLLPASEGIKLAPIVIRVFVQSIGEVVDSIDTTGTSSSDENGAESAFDFFGADLDLTRVSTAISDMAGRLHNEGGLDLIKSILKHTRRKNPANGNWEFIGRNAAQFDSAYQANYGELAFAIWFVLKANFGPAFSRLPFVTGG